jgi:hypothetical protein
MSQALPIAQGENGEEDDGSEDYVSDGVRQGCSGEQGLRGGEQEDAAERADGARPIAPASAFSVVS